VRNAGHLSGAGQIALPPSPATGHSGSATPGGGTNSLTALAAAHVGIAMHKVADIARLTADIALLEDGVDRVADAKELANSALARIARKCPITVGLNTAILRLAATGALASIATAMLHNGITIGPLLNAVRRTSERQLGHLAWAASSSQDAASRSVQICSGSGETS
jgi:hypothetical protein